jgi:hypothetical protein
MTMPALRRGGCCGWRRDILDIAQHRACPTVRFLFQIDRLALYFPAAEQIYGAAIAAPAR